MPLRAPDREVAARGSFARQPVQVATYARCGNPGSRCNWPSGKMLAGDQDPLRGAWIGTARATPSRTARVGGRLLRPRGAKQGGATWGRLDRALRGPRSWYWRV